MPRSQGDITKKGKLWHYGDKEFRRTVSSFAVTEDLLYAADLSGFLHCIDKKTGRPEVGLRYVRRDLGLADGD